MNKKILALAVLGCTLFSSQALAKDADWNLLGENKSGAYYVDAASLKPVGKEADLTQASTKAVFKDKAFLRILNDHFAKKLKENDTAAGCELIVTLNSVQNTYKIDQIKVVSEKGKTLESRKLQEEFSPIPARTFVAQLNQEVKAWKIQKSHPLTVGRVKPGEKGKRLKVKKASSSPALRVGKATKPKSAKAKVVPVKKTQKGTN